MRTWILLAGFLGIGAAHAADLPPVPEGGAYYSLERRVAPLVIYDYEPGVVVRAYWLAPWRNRHYFPASGEAPVIGRDEDLSPSREPPEPADSYSRHWSTSPAFVPERPLPERPLK